MRGVGAYLLADRRRRAWVSVKQLVGLVAAIATLVYVGEAWPAFHFLHTAAAANATWAVRVNGPLTAKDVGRIDAMARASGSRWIGLNVCGGGAWIEGRRGRKTIPGEVSLYDPSSISRIGGTMFSDAMRVQGRMSGSDAIAVDMLTARALGLRLGDRIVVHQSFVMPDSELRTVALPGTVRATYSPAESLRGLLVPSNAEVRGVLREMADVVFSDVYLSNSGGETVVLRGFASNSLPDEWSVETISLRRARSEQSARDAVSAGFRTTGALVALVLVMVYVVREQTVTNERRRKPFAVLLALGARPAGIVRALALEQTAILGVAVGLGLLLGTEALVSTAGAFVPPAEMRRIVAALIAVLATLVSAAVALAWLRLRRIPLARLLATE